MIISHNYVYFITLHLIDFIYCWEHKLFKTDSLNSPRYFFVLFWDLRFFKYVFMYSMHDTCWVNHLEIKKKAFPPQLYFHFSSLIIDSNDSSLSDLKLKLEILWAMLTKWYPPRSPMFCMAKSLFCSGKPQNHADKNLK